MNSFDRKQELKTIIAYLIEKLESEKSYEKVLSSMCTPPLKITREIASLFAELNLGDPGLFPETVKMEQDVLEFLANLLNAPKGWFGSITSGGSESNLIGCWAARNWSYKNKSIEKGKLILPKSAHVSFEKAIDLLNLKAEWISLNSDFQVDVEAVKSAIDKDTIGIIGIAGTTGTGMCDNIKALSDLAEDYNLYLHIDAAFGGTIYPFLKKIGNKNTASFDFINRGVKSITIDTHKILAGLIPGGSIIFRSNEFSDTIVKTISYLSNPFTKQVTITGTRSGASVIASWVLLKKFGEPYILERIKKSMNISNYLIEKLKEISHINLAFKPPINIVGFTSNLMPSKELVKELHKKGWKLSYYSDWVRIVVMPHINKSTIDQFISDLKTILQVK